MQAELSIFHFSIFLFDHLPLNTEYMLSTATRTEQEQLQQKLQVIEKKIIVGGENLLEKAEEQERLLAESAKELEQRKEKEGELKKALEEKEVSEILEYH